MPILTIYLNRIFFFKIKLKVNIIELLKFFSFWYCNFLTDNHLPCSSNRKQIKNVYLEKIKSIFEVYKYRTTYEVKMIYYIYMITLQMSLKLKFISFSIIYEVLHLTVMVCVMLKNIYIYFLTSIFITYKRHSNASIYATEKKRKYIYIRHLLKVTEKIYGIRDFSLYTKYTISLFVFGGI